MFAENGKISLHQLRCLLFLDWAGKQILVLPMICRGLAGWNYMAAVLLGCVWICLLVRILSGVCRRMEGSFTEYMEKRLGKVFATAAGIIFLLYLLVNQNFLAWMTARVCHTFLLPEIPEYVPGGLFLIAGFFTALADGQGRGRGAQFLWIPVGFALTVMIIAAMGSLRLENYLPKETFQFTEVFTQSGKVFAAMMAVIFLLYESPYIQWTGKNMEKDLQKCLFLPMSFLLIALLTAVGVFGTEGLERLTWPMITLMNSARVPGVFLQRHDAVFLSFLLFSLFTAAGAGSHYMRRIAGEMFQKENGHWWFYAGFLIRTAVFFATGNFERAGKLYTGLAFCALVPVMVFIPILLMVIERRKERKR